MPTVAAWANDLRAVFGTAEMQTALRDLGYYASEGGRVIDTRKLLGSTIVTASQTPEIVIAKTGGARGR